MGTRNCADSGHVDRRLPPRHRGVPRDRARSGESLIDSNASIFESCGVGFVATLDNQPSHDILDEGSHRPCAPRASRCRGCRWQIERWHRHSYLHPPPAPAGFHRHHLSTPSQPLAVGMVFLSCGASSRRQRSAERELEQAIAAQGLLHPRLARRSHAIRRFSVKSRLSTLPGIRQIAR
jgi:hypothetical protein